MEFCITNEVTWRVSHLAYFSSIVSLFLFPLRGNKHKCNGRRGHPRGWFRADTNLPGDKAVGEAEVRDWYVPRMWQEAMTSGQFTRHAGCCMLQGTGHTQYSWMPSPAWPGWWPAPLSGSPSPELTTQSLSGYGTQLYRSAALCHWGRPGFVSAGVQIHILTLQALSLSGLTLSPTGSREGKGKGVALPVYPLRTPLRTQAPAGKRPLMAPQPEGLAPSPFLPGHPEHSRHPFPLPGPSGKQLVPAAAPHPLAPVPQLFLLTSLDRAPKSNCLLGSHPSASKVRPGQAPEGQEWTICLLGGWAGKVLYLSKLLLVLFKMTRVPAHI